MNFLSRLFGKSEPKAAKAPEPILYKDCRIFAQPIKDGGVFRIAARIEKDFGAETKTHNLIRADTRTSLDEAVDASADKAKQAIDQLGDAIFH
jgi:hypothetical protein